MSGCIERTEVSWEPSAFKKISSLHRGTLGTPSRIICPPLPTIDHERAANPRNGRRENVDAAFIRDPFQRPVTTDFPVAFACKQQRGQYLPGPPIVYVLFDSRPTIYPVLLAPRALTPAVG